MICELRFNEHAKNGVASALTNKHDINKIKHQETYFIHT